MNRAWKKAAVAALFVMASGYTLADDRPDATIDYSGGAVAAGVGVNWGHGTLHYQGHDYPFRVNGVRLLDLGAQKFAGTGEVYHLTKLEDFNGTYGAASAGATVAESGKSTSSMKNTKGVVINLHSNGKGVELTAALEGVDFQLAEEQRMRCASGACPASKHHASVP